MDLFKNIGFQMKKTSIFIFCFYHLQLLMQVGLTVFWKIYSYNVLFYMPSGEEKFLGNAKSISSCQNMAGYEANRLSVPMSYLCCKTDGKSFCISKHK